MKRPPVYGEVPSKYELVKGLREFDMKNLYKWYFIENKNDWDGLDYYLRLRVSDLAQIRDDLMQVPAIKWYESKYVIPDLRGRSEEYGQPDPTYTYERSLDEIITIIKVMQYKHSCFQRYCYWYSDFKEKAELRNLIIKSIEQNSRLTYEDMVGLDEEKDVATMLEHLIETQELTIKSPDKKFREGEKRFNWVSYPRISWMIKSKNDSKYVSIETIREKLGFNPLTFKDIDKKIINGDKSIKELLKDLSVAEIDCIMTAVAEDPDYWIKANKEGM